ncbi:MAG: deoxyribonuclease IV [Nitrospirota bacterium]
MRLGAHMSISGGLHLSLERGKAVGCDVIQLFTKNSTQWKGRIIKEEEAALFKETADKTGVEALAVHDSYLINLASPDDIVWGKSTEAFHQEMVRTEKLGIPYLVTHPGSHKDSGEDAGLNRIAGALNMLLRMTPDFKKMILIETTAGQGASLGYRFEQIRSIIDQVMEPERLGVCLDTCHIFAAGYDIRDQESYNKTMEEFDRAIGITKIRLFHLNDSLKAFSSRVDRHQHIGTGFIGLEGFRLLLRDKRFSDIPKVLETPKGEDMQEDVINLKTLRGLVN